MSYKSVEADLSVLILFTELLEAQMKNPFTFEPYHKKVRYPIDYYQFSLDFVRPFVDQAHSAVHGKDVLAQISKQLKNKENCVLLANHQTEADPQIISLSSRSRTRRQNYLCRR